VTPGNVEFVQVVVSMTSCTGTIAAILHVDGRRFAARRGEHTWLPATIEGAVLGTFLFSWLYGCPALLIHFTKSRWSLGGLGLGAFWAAVLFGADLGAQIAALGAIDWLGL
jgi:hypothetical protein